MEVRKKIANYHLEFPKTIGEIVDYPSSISEDFISGTDRLTLIDLVISLKNKELKNYELYSEAIYDLNRVYEYLSDRNLFDDFLKQNETINNCN